jgi:hypothetical protein
MGEVSFETLLHEFLHILHENKHTPGTLLDYLHWLIEYNLYLDPRGILHTQRAVHVLLEDIYISLRAQKEEMPGSADRRLGEKALRELPAPFLSTRRAPDEWRDGRAQAGEGHHLHPADGEPSDDLLELSEIATRFKKVVILGDPGSGKTTVLRYLALQYASSLKSSVEQRSTGQQTAPFPLLIRIADYAEYGLPKGKSPSDFLVDYLRLHECPDGGLADLLTTRLAEGRCCILLDGLDEIAGADERRAVVRQIEEFARRCRNTDTTIQHMPVLHLL